MNNQEALIQLRWLRDESYLRVDKDFTVPLDMAIPALEKQLLKKPDKEDEKDMRCPVCGTWSSKIFEHQYCCYCGQRIVRSVEE